MATFAIKNVPLALTTLANALFGEFPDYDADNPIPNSTELEQSEYAGRARVREQLDYFLNSLGGTEPTALDAFGLPGSVYTDALKIGLDRIYTGFPTTTWPDTPPETRRAYYGTIRRKTGIIGNSFTETREEFKAREIAWSLDVHVPDHLLGKIQAHWDESYFVPTNATGSTTVANAMAALTRTNLTPGVLNADAIEGYSLYVIVSANTADANRVSSDAYEAPTSGRALTLANALGIPVEDVLATAIRYGLAAIRDQAPSPGGYVQPRTVAFPDWTSSRRY